MLGPGGSLLVQVLPLHLPGGFVILVAVIVAFAQLHLGLERRVPVVVRLLLDLDPVVTVAVVVGLLVLRLRTAFLAGVG